VCVRIYVRHMSRVSVCVCVCKNICLTHVASECVCVCVMICQTDMSDTSVDMSDTFLSV